MDDIFTNLKSEKYREDDLKHLLYNTCTNNSGHHYIRILKAFKSPEIKDLSEDEKKFIDHPLIKEFCLRFYIPKEPLSLKNESSHYGGTAMKQKNNSDPKIKHVVIMVNGLNEVLTDHFKFYDFLGARFAEKNIASVLLSTPYHLHRVKQNTNKEKDSFRIKTPDTIFSSPIDYFIHYKITQSEIIALAKKIKQIGESDPYDLMFYENHFAEDVKVSLLGYSLGGLITLGTLLQITSNKKDGNETLIDSCILYNSAPKLGSATTSDIGIEKTEWDNLWKQFGDLMLDSKIDTNNPSNNEISSFFKDLYIGIRNSNPRHSLTKKLIHDNSKKLLLIMSGADDIIDTKAWDDYLAYQEGDRQQTIINEFIFAGTGHSPMIEAQGAEILPRIVEVMTDHILKNQQSHWQ